MDPKEPTIYPEYQGRNMHNMKELLQMPLHFFGIEDGVDLKTIGTVMELCRFGQMDYVSPEAVVKVTKKVSGTMRSMEGEIPVEAQVEAQVDCFLFGAPVRFGSPIDVVCYKNIAIPGVTEETYNVAFVMKDSIYNRTANMTIDIGSPSPDDYIWMLQNNIFGKVRCLVDALNTLIEGEFTIGTGPLTVFESTSEEEGFSKEEAEIVEVSIENRGLYPNFYAQADEIHEDEEA